MRKGKLFCVGIIPILLCSLALLVLTLAMEWRDIEQKVEFSASAALEAPQHAWAKVETYNLGRQVLITGAAPSEAAIDEAISAVNSASGVLTASHNGEALAKIASEPPRLNAKLSNGKLKLSGVVSSKSEINELIRAATRHFGADNVTHSLTHNENTKALPPSNFLSVLFIEDAALADLNLRLDDAGVQVNGLVTTQAAYDHISQTVRGFSMQVSRQVRFVPPTPKLDCAKLVQNLMASAKINFATAKSEIEQESFGLLDQIAETAKKCPDAEFAVTGHTDASGNEQFNVTLSQRRAQAVIDYLVLAGLASDRFTAVGRGSASPIAENNSDEGRAANRRIEFKLKN